RQAIMSDLVEKKDLTNAIALNTATFQATAVVGPALAGFLIPVIGVAACLYINAFSFVVVLWTLYAMQFPPQTRSAAKTSVTQNLAEGIAYLRTNPVALALVILAFGPTFFGQPYINMLAVFARDVLDIGPRGLGFLMSSASVGSVVGALVVASLGDFRRKGYFILGSLIAFGVFLSLFALSPWPLVSAILLVGVGGLFSAYSSANNTAVQLMVPDQLRGRVMGIFLLNRSMTPLGTSLAGSLASLVGAPLTMAAMGGAVIILGLSAAVKVPGLRRAGGDPLG
ncbi:MAG: MFS transporter, partial [Dehalococcoidia bacterium]|nr:MFS transporter [Dehalococcoidia bacterium]